MNNKNSTGTGHYFLPSEITPKIQKFVIVKYKIVK